MFGLKSSCEIEEETEAVVTSALRLGALQDCFCPRSLPLRQMIKDIPQLVDLAALHQSNVAEEIADRFPQRLRAVEDHRQTAVGAQTAALTNCSLSFTHRIGRAR
jgi:hypothetical protein